MLEKGLERSLSLGMVVAISLSAMLGSGIFVLPGIAASEAGPHVWAAYLLAAIFILPAALSKSELATAMPTSGGSYVYFERSFGPLIGTVAGVSLWLSLTLKSSFALTGIAAYLGILTSSLPVESISLSLLACIIILNVVGIVKVAKVQAVAVTVSVLALVAIIILGLPKVDFTLANQMVPFEFERLFAATGLVFVSYAGVTKIAAISEEIKDPSRNLPLGMLISLAIACLLYCATVYVMAGNIPFVELTQTKYPVYTVTKQLMGGTLGYAAAFLGILVMSSMANSGLLASSRFPFAMSRDGLMPSIFSKIHPQFKTPIVCILGTGTAMGVIILTLDLYQIAKMASALKVLAFIGINICVIVLRETNVQWYRPGYYSPLYPWTQFFGILSGIPLLYLLGSVVFDALLLVSIPGMFLFFIYGRKKTNRQGVIRLYGKRASLLLRSGRLHGERSSRKKSSKVHTAVSTSVGTNEEASSTISSLRTAAVVPLFGTERAPEMLVEIGAALADGENIEVVHLTEAPEQTMLAAMPMEGTMLNSLQRRITTMAERENFSADFNSVVTHDLITTVDDLSRATDADWIVVEWTGNLSRGILLHSPVGWLINHLHCNLALLRDRSIRYVKKMLVLCQPKRDEDLVAETSIHLGEIYKADLSFVQVVPLSSTDEELKIVKQKLENYAASFHGNSEIMVIRSNTEMQTVLDMSPNYDLMVTGSPPKPSTFKTVFGVPVDRLTSMAACSVLRLRRPKLRNTLP